MIKLSWRFFSYIPVSSLDIEDLSGLVPKIGNHG